MITLATIIKNMNQYLVQIKKKSDEETGDDDETFPGLITDLFIWL